MFSNNNNNTDIENMKNDTLIILDYLVLSEYSNWKHLYSFTVNDQGFEI